ncbi:MAG: PTS sugar transporter subunit IIBC [Paraclostridium sp.]
MKNIVAICENKECVNALVKACDKMGYNIETEIQKNNIIIDEISEVQIKKADAVLFSLSCSIEDVEGIERFIDCEYYEVDPAMIVSNTIEILKEIEMDIN